MTERDTNEPLIPVDGDGASGGQRGGRESVELEIRDCRGTYTIPFIRCADDLPLRLGFDDARLHEATIALAKDGAVVGRTKASTEDPSVSFGSLAPGEYALTVDGFEKNGQPVCRREYGPIGIGTVVAALGDSLTEGYYGHGYHRPDLRLKAGDFPADSVSRDGRNYPQYAPTTHLYLPAVNCFQSWLTVLNDALAAALDAPVFIANEGWGGITTAKYLARMRDDGNWRARMKALRPSLWLIHLGVNDERAKETSEDVALNLQAMVDILRAELGADPRRIFVAKPSYDYFEGAPAILSSYCRAIDRIVERNGLSRGPDFFAFFAHDKERWYGDDPVHPKVEGIDMMGRLWCTAVTKALGQRR